MPKKKTTEEYIKECKEKGYALPIEEYRGSKVKIKHKCSKGHIYEQTPSSHLCGRGCPICKGGISYTYRDYDKECREKRYDLPIEEYKGSHTKIKHKCKNGHIYEQTPSSHLKGFGCPYCAGNKKKTTDSYVQECKEKDQDLPIEEYVNNSTKIKHKCSKGHIYLQTPSNHLKGQGCPVCKGSFLKEYQEYYNECKTKGYDLPTARYTNAQTKITHKCSKGHLYSQRPYSHLEGYGCPLCNESKGEKYIRNYLNENHINYTPQKRFDDLKDKTYLSYDFYLPKQNILIEYQGKQHYEENKHFGGKAQLKLQQYHDKLKKEYAKKNGYKLLELHYSLDTQEKVNKYLSRRIKD